MYQSISTARRALPSVRPFSSLFMPPQCVGCSQQGAVLCRRCRFGLLATSAVVVGVTRGETVYAAAPFAGIVRDIITGLKYRNRRDAARVLARLIAERIDLSSVDLVTWAPTTDRHARRRGFDQAELLARELGRLIGAPSRRLLYRRQGPGQTGRTRAERLALDAPSSFRGHSPRPSLRVVVVDDVVTTGSTLLAARESLLAAGVGDVVCVAAAATPSGVPAGRRVTGVGLTSPAGHHR